MTLEEAEIMRFKIKEKKKFYPIHEPMKTNKIAVCNENLSQETIKLNQINPKFLRNKRQGSIINDIKNLFLNDE